MFTTGLTHPAAVAHAFLALLAGFVCMVFLTVTVSALLRRWVPEWAGHPRPLQPRLQPGFVVVNLGSTFLAAAAGGYVAAWEAGRAALATVLALAVIVLVLGALSALQARGKQPVWYQLVLVILAPLGTVAGGLLRLRVLGVL